MKRWMMHLLCCGVLLACQSERMVPVESSPCRVDSCSRGPSEGKEKSDLGYHSFIAMVETMSTLDWDLTTIDVSSRIIHARSCPWNYCLDISIKTFKNGEVEIHPRGEPKPKYRTLRNIDTIVDRFSEVSCFSATLLEDRLSEQGYRLSVQ